MKKYRVTLNNYSIVTKKLVSTNSCTFKSEKAAREYADMWESKFKDITKATIEEIEED